MYEFTQTYTYTCENGNSGHMHAPNELQLQIQATYDLKLKGRFVGPFNDSYAWLTTSMSVRILTNGRRHIAE
jgi:hypothetical protein